MYHWLISALQLSYTDLRKYQYKPFSGVGEKAKIRYFKGFGLIVVIMLTIFIIVFILTAKLSASSSNIIDINTRDNYFPKQESSIKSLTKPLRPPKRIFHNYILPKTPSTQLIALQNDAKYLLGRENSLPTYARQPNGFILRRKVEIAQPRVDWNATPFPTSMLVRKTLTPPNIREQIPRPPRLKRKRSKRRRHYDELENPRPFHFPLDGPAPEEFKKLHPSIYELGFSNDRANNIQDILRYLNVRDKERKKMRRVRNHAIQFSGQYRHLKADSVAEILKSLQRKPGEMPQMTPHQKHRSTNQIPHLSIDPFYPFKPKSANEVNLLAIQQQAMLRGKKQKFNSVLDFEEERRNQLHWKNRPNYAGDADYDVLNKTKPLKLLLDIYPAEAHDHIDETRSTPMKVKPNKKGKHFPTPLLPLPILDASYYNSINFPQLHQAKYPQPSNYYMHNHLAASDTQSFTQSEPENAGQILLHLNVFPKDKANGRAEHFGKSLSGNGLDVLTEGFDDRIAQTTSSVMSKQAIDGKSFETPEASGTREPANNTSFEDPIVVDEQKENDEFPLFREISENTANNTDSHVTSGMGMTIPLVNEPQKTSTGFRMPVENMLKFQMNDAL